MSTIGKMSFNLYGNLTIAEAVEALEANASVKVVRADLVGEMVTLTYEMYEVAGDPPECEECYECGGCCNYHEHWCPYKDAWD